MLCPVSTLRRPGDPDAPARALGGPAATLVSFLALAAASAPALAAPAATPGATDAAATAAPEAAGGSPTPSATSADPGPAAPSATASPEAAPSATAAPEAPPAPATAAAPGPSPATAAAGPATPTDLARKTASKPPRVDGPYIGGTIGPSATFARVNNFPTPDVLPGGSASLRVGQAIYPWMTIGLEITGSYARRGAEPSQRLLQGGVLIDFGFLPVPRIPFSLHVGFGAGGGAMRQADRSARSGFGGAVFTGSARYEIFPLAARKRPRRGGGFSLGPELGWVGFTPAARGRPMSNTVYLGLFLGFYFGS